MTSNENESENIQQEVQNILNYVAKLEHIKKYDVFANINSIEGEGFLSEFFTGVIKNKENDQKIQVAIKRGKTDGFSLGFKNEYIFKNEKNFYSQLFPELDKYQREKKVQRLFDHIPKYLAGNVESKNMFIAMKNLKAEGYLLFNKKEYLDRKHLEFIFKTYGRFHALSFSFKRKYPEQFENLMGNIFNVPERFSEVEDVITQMSLSLSTAMETFDPITEKNILTKLKKINVKKAMEKVQIYKGKHKCLTHGDCWSNNMLFKYKESGELEDMKLVDFQCIGYGSPAYDLSYFFYAGVSKEDMDKLDYYLDLYYKSFSSFAIELGEDPEELLPMSILKKEWKEYSMWGILLGLQVWCIKFMDKTEIAEVTREKGLTISQYWDLFGVKMAEVRKGSKYRERTRNICLHAFDYGIL